MWLVRRLQSTSNRALAALCVPAHHSELLARCEETFVLVSLPSIASKAGVMVRKKVDARVRSLIENGVKTNHRSIFVLVGDHGKDQASAVPSVHDMKAYQAAAESECSLIFRSCPDCF